MFTTIKHVSRHQNTQHFGAMLPVELTNEDIKNSAAYKEYYVIALRAAPPKTKASVRKTQSSFDTTMPPPTAAGIRLLTSAKRKQPAKSSKAKGLSVLYEVALTEAEQIKLATKRSLQQTHIYQASGSGADEGTEDEDEQDDDDQDDNDDDQDSDNEGDDFIHPKLSTHDEEAKDEETFDPIVQTSSQVENSNDESNDDESHGMNVGGDEGPNAEDDDEELYRDVNINLEGIESLFESTRRVNVPVTTTVVPLLVTTQTLPPSSIPIISQVQQAQAPSPTTAPSTSLQDLPNFGSLFGFDHRLKTSEANFSKLRDEAQAKNEDFLNKQNENIQKIIKEQDKEQVKVQVSKILPKIEKTVNEQLKADVLTQASNSSKTSYDVVADLSELELKKILIEKIERNKTIHRSDEQRNLYKGLVDSYKCDKIILDTYRDTVTLKRRHDNEDKDEEPSAGSDRGESAPVEEPMQTTKYLEEPSHQEFETGAADDQPVVEASQHPEWFQKQTKPPTPDSFLMNRLKVDTLTPELLAGPTYELMKGSCKSRRVIPFDHFINNDLEYLRGGASSQKYTTSVIKTKAADYGHIKWIEHLVPCTMWSQASVSYDKYALWGISHLGLKRQQFYGFLASGESARDVYSKRRIIAVTELQVIEWHNYKHLDWIIVRKDDDKLNKFKEGNLKGLRIQDIKYMLLLLFQGKRTNLIVKERFAFNVSLRMFTRSIVIQRRVEDL
nr:hypothetical protein [Tanacetum cinerariifolium]